MLRLRYVASCITLLFIAACGEPPPGTEATQTATACTESQLISQCPLGSNPQLDATATSSCQGAAQGDLIEESGSVVAGCQGTGSCVVRCQFEDPCPCGVASFTRDAIECAECVTACGDGVCEAGESPEDCPTDCSDTCNASATRCVGDEVQTCSQMRVWERTRECPTGSSCSEADGDAVCVQNEGTCGDGDCNINEDVATCPTDCSNTCVAADTRCSGDQIQTCNQNSVWESPIDCPTEQVCNVVTGDAICRNIAVGCGDGEVQEPEQCDDGEDCGSGSCNSNTVPNACRNDCSLPECGDGVEDDGEQCDDGDEINDNICTNACIDPRCGDEILQMGEDCDDGDANNSDVEPNACRTNCDYPSCGDAVIDDDPLGGGIPETCEQGDVATCEDFDFLLGESACQSCQLDLTMCAIPELVWFDHSLEGGLTCGVASDGTGHCWGSNEYGEAEVPPGTYQSISPKEEVSCGLHTDGSISCWGADGDETQPEDTPPEGSFHSLVVSASSIWDGVWIGCALRDDTNRPSCWDDDGLTSPHPDLEFRSLTAGWDIVCGIEMDDTVVCWDERYDSQGSLPDVPETTFSTLDAHHFGNRFCGLTTEGGIDCFSLDSSTPIPPSGDGEVFVQAEAGPGFVCGLDGGGEISCWESTNPIRALPDIPDGFVAKQIRISDEESLCALDPMGFLVCFPLEGRGEAAHVSPYARWRWRSVFPAQQTACGLSEYGVVDCWGYAADIVEALIPEGLPVNFAFQYSGGDSLCALDTGDVSCWGDLPSYLDQQIQAFDLSASTGCGLDNVGALHCWTEDESDPVFVDVPEAGQFESLSLTSSDSRFGCALTTGGDIDCWGENDGASVTDKSGEYEAVETGADAACAITGTGTLDCWGAGAVENALDSEPEGDDFIALSLGRDSACAQHDGGQWECWGRGGEQLTALFGSRTVDNIQVHENTFCAMEGDRPLCAAVTFIDSVIVVPLHPPEPSNTFDLVWLDNATPDSGIGVNTRQQPVVWPGGDWQPLLDDRYPVRPDELAAGRGTQCTALGVLECDDPDSSIFSLKPATAYDFIRIAQNTICGYDEVNGVDCWPFGEVVDGEPEGGVKQLEMGDDFACVRMSDDTLACWGSGTGATDAPSGVVLDFDLGDNHACAIRSDRTTSCWGESTDGRTTAPFGEFTRISLGDEHSCALDTEGAVACWGTDLFGETEDREGPFVDVWASDGTTCAKRVNGELSCWGELYRSF